VLNVEVEEVVVLDVRSMLEEVELDDPVELDDSIELDDSVELGDSVKLEDMSDDPVNSNEVDDVLVELQIVVEEEELELSETELA
jgi:hypothetical protein